MEWLQKLRARVCILESSRCCGSLHRCFHLSLFRRWKHWSRCKDGKEIVSQKRGDGNFLMLHIFSPLFSTSFSTTFQIFLAHFLGLSPRMSAFLVLQFGMAAASVHCCQNGKLYALRQLCTSLFLLSKFMQSSRYGSRPWQTMYDTFFPHFLPISILGFSARKMLSCAVSFTNCVLRCRRLEGLGVDNLRFP